MASPTAPHVHPGRPDINADLQGVVRLVHQEFDDRLDPRAIDECLADVAGQFDDARVRSFVPLLVRRYVSAELHARLVDA